MRNDNHLDMIHVIGEHVNNDFETEVTKKNSNWNLVSSSKVIDIRVCDITFSSITSLAETPPTFSSDICHINQISNSDERNGYIQVFLRNG
jgi:hypothetical protein